MSAVGPVLSSSSPLASDLKNQALRRFFVGSLALLLLPCRTSGTVFVGELCLLSKWIDDVERRFDALLVL